MKYDFPGIKKAGAAALKVALASVPWLAWLAKAPGIDPLLEMLMNWLANNGLVVFNLGAILVEGEFDQKGFDQALDQGLKEVQIGRDKITPARGKEIDDAVRKAAKKFIRITSAP